MDDKYLLLHILDRFRNAFACSLKLFCDGLGGFPNILPHFAHILLHLCCEPEGFNRLEISQVSAHITFPQRYASTAHRPTTEVE